MASGMEPVQLKYSFDMPTISGTYFVDLSQIASLTNRKFLRQGMNWVVSNVEYWTDGTSHMSVSTLPQTWTMANAWTKSFKLWQESQDQVLDQEPSIQSKYSDFKIYFDVDHQVLGSANNLKPYGFHVAAAGAAYDWDMSTFQVPNDPVSGTTTQYNIHGIGPSTAASVGAIAGYAASRARPNQEEPNVPTATANPESWMMDLFDVGENLPDIRQDIEDMNDEPPYLIGPDDAIEEYYPGGTLQAETYQSFLQDILVTRVSTALASDSTGSFLAPCGLLRFDIDNGLVPETDPTQIIIFIEVSPGPVKGFLAQPMQEMN